MSNRRLKALLLAWLACVALLSQSSRAQIGGAGGGLFTVLIIGGEVWTAGYNGTGQLGVGSSGQRQYRTSVVPFGAAAVAAGSEHSLAMMSDGSMYAWGNGYAGQLGLSPASPRYTPIAVPLSGIVAISASNNRSYAVGPGGVVYMFGFGYLGDGIGAKGVLTPTQVPGLTGAIGVASGGDHVLVLKSDGTVVAWGYNAGGQLGDGSTTTRLTPQAVPGLTNIVQVAAGAGHSVALDASGHVFTWGGNGAGQIGDGTQTSRLSPWQVTGLSSLTITQIAAGSNHTLVRASDGTVHGWGSNGQGQIGDGTSSPTRWTPTFITTLPNIITTVAAGTDNSFAFASDGRVWGWGKNGNGELGDGTTLPRYAPTLLAEAGSNGNWMVGTPVFSGSSPNTPSSPYGQPQTVIITSATPGATVRYTTNGNVPTESDPEVPAGGVAVDQSLTLKARAFKTGMPASTVTSGSWLLRVNSPVMAPWGTTYSSPVTVTLSTSSQGAEVRYTVDGSEPTAASPLYTTPLPIATRTSLKAKGFKAGWESSGTVPQEYSFNFGKLAAPTMSPAAGTYDTDQTITLTAPFPAAQIRYTTDGNPPSASSTLYTVPILRTATTTLKASAFHVDWVTSDTTTGVYTLQVGTPTMSLASGEYAPPQAVTISTTTPGATLRFTTTGATPTVTDAVVPATGIVLGNFTLKVVGFKTGYNPSQVATANYALSSDLTSRNISARYYSSLAMSRDGVLSAFGSNTYGNLGDNSTTNRSVPVRVQGITGVVDVSAGSYHTLAATVDGRVYAWGNGGNGRLGNNSNSQQLLPVLVGGLPSVTHVAAGGMHSLAVTTSGQVYAWGYNGNGRLGDGSTTDRWIPTLVPGLSNVVGVAAGESHSLAWTNTGQVWAWGVNNEGQLGDGSTTQRVSPVQITTLTGVTQLVASVSHSMALTSSGAVYTWGGGSNGQIGDGFQVQRNSPVLISALSNIAAIGAGSAHSLAVTSTGALYTWGSNDNYQLGDGTPTRRLSPVLIAGASNFVRVTGGLTHSVALDDDDQLWTWGTGVVGQLGNGASGGGTVQYTPTLVNPGTVTAPSVSPIPTTYLHPQTVTLTTSVGTFVRYTLDGTEPTASSTIYTAPFVIAVTTTVKAKAFQNDWTPSPTTTALYTIQEAATPVITPPTGTYTSEQTVTMTTSTPGATIRYTLNGTEPLSSSTEYTSEFQVSTATTVKAKAFKSGFGDSPTATSVITLNYGTLATPTASPAAGTYLPGTEVTLSGPAGATLRYTTNNTEPTASSTVYTAPIAIAATSTLQARAFKTDWTPSTPLVATYTISTNQSPTAANDSVNTKEDTAVTVPVLVNDTDPDSDTLTISAVTQGAHGSVSIGSGNVTYTPALNTNGPDTFTYTISDGNGHTASASVAVAVQAVNDAPIVTVLATPNDGQAPLDVTFLADATDADSPTLTYSWNFGDGQTATTPASAPHLYPTAGTYFAKLTVSDGTASVLRTAVVTVRPASGGEAPPPNPTTTAPPTAPDVATDFGDATAFLYTSAAPVQRDVVSGTIEPARAAVIRGRVFDQAGTPLPGAKVTVADQPAFGYTFTRDDGMFDLAVNGGGIVVVRLEKNGYLSSQRRVETQWQDYSWMDNVRLVPLDGVISTVEFHASASASAQIAQGNAVTDADGTRQPTLIVPDGGSNATIHKPDGTVLPALSQLHIRATEYTVGTSRTGREMMPGDLPPTSGYTYAVELTAEEAIAVNATNVTFSPALAFYQENFLNFPVGTSVPAGYYDRQRAAWVPSDNGLIVKVLAIDPVTHLADLDIDGSGTAATPAALAALGVTEGERIKVGTLYPVDRSLWRVPIAHFTPYDFNWPFRPPLDAQNPNLGDPKTNPKKKGDCDKVPGSIISCETQGLGERVGISGTPYTLNYLSTRQPGHTAGGLLDIELSSASISPSLKRIEVKVQIAGQQFEQEITTPQPNMRLPFAWNGQDAYGRRVYGAQRAKVAVGHVYDGVYFINDTGYYGRDFGVPGNVAITGGRGRTEAAFRQTFEESLTFDPPTTSGLGGWTLDVHHTFDPYSGTLLRGDGGEESREFTALSARTVAGGGLVPPTASGTPAKEAQLDASSFAPAPNGSIFFVHAPKVSRLDADGLVRQLPDMPALPALYRAGSLIAVDRQNRVLVGVPANAYEGGGGCSEGGHAEGVSVWMLDAANVWSEVTTVATPEDIDNCGVPLVAVGPDDAIYVTQGPYLYLFRAGDSAPALIAQVGEDGVGYGINSITVGADGTVYVGSHGFIDKIDPGGNRTRVAGTGTLGFSGDHGPATAAQLSIPYSLQIDASGSVYFVESGSAARRIRRITPQGIISTIVGGGTAGTPLRDGVPVLGASIGFGAIAFGPGGKMWALDTRLRTLGMDSTIASASPTAIQVVSSNGSEVYVFDRGRHMQTLQALTGIVLRTFEYDTENRLIGVVDGHGNRTTIERDGNGTPLRIIAPFGQVTALTLDQDGMLSAVTAPGNETTQLTYQAGGLLTSFTTPESNTSTFTYDSLGKLLSDEDPGGGVQTLTRNYLPNGWSTSLGHNAGYAREWVTERPDTGEEVSRTLHPGVSTPLVSTTYPDGRTEIAYPQGMHVMQEHGPDPRFGGQVSFKKSVTMSMPSGLTSTTMRTRTAVLADPDDPLSVQTFTTATTTNSRVRTTVYDAATRTLTTTSPAGRHTTTTFNSAGLPVQFERQGLHPVIKAYNTLGQLTGVTVGTRTSTLTYDSGGRVASLAHPHGGSATYGYDGAGHLTSMTMPGSSGSRTISFSFDDDGKLRGLTPPGRPEYALTFTPAGRVASYTTPGGTGTATYRVDKQLETITRPGESPITVGYDTAGRVQQIVTPAGTVSTAYDASTGLISGITSPDAELSFSYDGLLPLEEEWSGTVSGKVSSTFDNNFRVISQSVNGANTVSASYDLDGLLTSAGALTLTRHAETGLVTGATIGSLTDTITPDGYGEVQSYSTTYGATPLAAFSYARDDLGRITQSTEVIGGGSHTFVYGYDPAGRLHQVTRDGTLFATYDYDQNGNRHTATTSSGPISATFDTQDRLVTAAGATYTYTGSGYLQTRTDGTSTTSYIYDAFGNLRSVTLPSGQVVSYLVDGMHRRIARLVNGTRTHAWLYEGKLHPVAELDELNTVATRYVYGTRPNVPEYMIRGGVTYRFITDARGSVRLVVNVNTGVIAQQLDYDAWGDVTADSNPGFQPFGFAGGLYDPHTRLHRFGARDYDGATGRWLATDPSVFTGGSNLYAYAHGDPVNFIDPAGDNPFLVAGLIGGALGFGSNLMWQLSDGRGWACVDWTDALIAGAFGAVGGALGVLPMSIPEAALMGGSLNIMQYNVATAANGEMWTNSGVVYNGLTGAYGGLVTGGAKAVNDAARQAAARTGEAVVGDALLDRSADTLSAVFSNMPCDSKKPNCQ